MKENYKTNVSIQLTAVQTKYRNIYQQTSENNFPEALQGNIAYSITLYVGKLQGNTTYSNIIVGSTTYTYN